MGSVCAFSPHQGKKKKPRWSAFALGQHDFRDPLLFNAEAFGSE